MCGHLLLRDRVGAELLDVRGRTETEIQRFVTVGIDAVIFPLMGLSGVTVSQVSCVIDGAPGCTHLVEWQ